MEKNISFLDEYNSLSSALVECLKSSQNQLKKHLTKKQLAIVVRAKSSFYIPFDLLNHLKINPIYTGPSVNVLLETKDFLAVNKPNKIHSLPQRYSDTDSVHNSLLNSKALKVNSGQYERGLLHRLDYETSGVLCFAKTDELYKKLREGFSDRFISKKYLAIVSGEIEDNNKLRNYLRGIGVKSSKMGVCEQDETDQREQANLSFKRLSYNEELNVSLVEVILETGQRHQIRVQLAHHGFPILGDEIYGGTKAQRVFLHSYLYKINLLDSEVEIKAREVSLFDRFFDLNSFL